MSARVWISDRWKGAKTGTGQRWRVVWIDPDTKKERSKSFRKKTDAEEHQTWMENSLRSDTYISPETAALTVRDAAEAWLNSKKRPKGSSLGRYKETMANHVYPRWGDTLLSAVKRPDVDKWLSDFLDGSAPRREGMRAHQGRMSPASGSAVLTMLNASLGTHWDRGGSERTRPAGLSFPRSKVIPSSF